MKSLRVRRRRSCRVGRRSVGKRSWGTGELGRLRLGLGLGVTNGDPNHEAAARAVPRGMDGDALLDGGAGRDVDEVVGDHSVDGAGGAEEMVGRGADLEAEALQQTFSMENALAGGERDGDGGGVAEDGVEVAKAIGAVECLQGLACGGGEDEGDGGFRHGGGSGGVGAVVIGTIHQDVVWMCVGVVGVLGCRYGYAAWSNAT